MGRSIISQIFIALLAFPFRLRVGLVVEGRTPGGLQCLSMAWISHQLRLAHLNKYWRDVD